MNYSKESQSCWTSSESLYKGIGSNGKLSRSRRSLFFGAPELTKSGRFQKTVPMFAAGGRFDHQYQVFPVTFMGKEELEKGNKF